MSRNTDTTLLDGIIASLVGHFGPNRVRLAVEKASRPALARESLPTSSALRDQKRVNVPVSELLENVRADEPKKHEILVQFNSRLRDQAILPSLQDLQRFAQLVGLKRIEKKSRRDVLPILIRHLLTLPVELLQEYISEAERISESERRKGFSVLTDKLLRK